MSSEVVWVPAWLKTYLQTDAAATQAVSKLNTKPYKIILARVMNLNLMWFKFQKSQLFLFVEFMIFFLENI